jgi:hypothetical protein
VQLLPVLERAALRLRYAWPEPQGIAIGHHNLAPAQLEEALTEVLRAAATLADTPAADTPAADTPAADTPEAQAKPW